jgi:CRP/FNR family transcriptional regulator
MRIPRPREKPETTADSTNAQHLLLAFPRDDELFRRAVERQIRAARPLGDVNPARRALRRVYPEADLHVQRGVPIHRRPSEVWFAFRDGRTSPLLPPEPWWQADGLATCDVDGGGALSAANAKARSLLGLPVGRGALGLLVNLVGAAAASQITGLSGDLAAVGRLTTVLAFRLPWGRAERIEVHAVHDGAPSGGHRMYFRSMGDRDTDTERQAVLRSSLRLATPPARRTALRGHTRRVLAPGERIAEGISGEPWAVVVVAGIVRAYMSVETSEPTLQYGSEGALLGTRWVGTDADVALGLQAVTPSIVLQLDAQRIDQLLLADQAFGLAALAESHSLARDLALSYVSAVATKLPERLAREIVVLAQLQPGEPYLAVTEQQLADGVGTIRESVGRTIADFRRRSWLATTRYGIIVLNEPALRRLAKLPAGGPPSVRPGPAIPSTAPPA